MRSIGRPRLLRRMHTLVFSVLTVCALVAAPAEAASTGNDKAPDAFVALRDVDPTIIEEIRYTGMHNFVGNPIPGYREPMCILTRATAEALHAAQRQLVRQGYTLKVYDCFRPQRAVDHFVAWAKQLNDRQMEGEFYPRVDKSKLFEDGYIAEQSGHSRGSTVDLTLVELPVRPQRPYIPGESLEPCHAPVEERFPDNSIDMGTGYDCFDTLSHTDDPRVVGEVKENRQKLKRTLESVGMENYPNEWWHFTLVKEPFPETYFDFPVSRFSLLD